MDLVTVLSVCTSGSGRSNYQARTTSAGPYLSPSPCSNNGQTIRSHTRNTRLKHAIIDIHRLLRPHSFLRDVLFTNLWLFMVYPNIPTLPLLLSKLASLVASYRPTHQGQSRVQRSRLDLESHGFLHDPR